MRQLLLFTAFFTLMLINATAQTIRYVKPVASGIGDGSSWANASSDLQAMINASGNNDQVWVAAGTYKPTTGTNRTISFTMKNAVTIYGGFPNDGSGTLTNRNPAANETILSGDIGTVGNVSDNSYHVIANGNGITATAQLDGFVITGGNANVASGNNLYGGGIFNDGNNGATCSPTIANCIFRQNMAYYGGAAYNTAESGTCNPTFSNCLFYQNQALYNSTFSYGGAFYCLGNVNLVLTNCTFAKNSALGRGGAIYCSNSFGSPNITLKNCILWSNTAVVAGNQILLSVSTLNLTNCLLQGGTAAISIFGGSTINNNGGLLTSDPLFADAANGNFSLSACSPAINTGDNTGITSTDITGNPRIYNNGTVDMGPYEYQSILPTWYLDADGDGYYTGTGTVACTSPGPGYTNAVVGGGDCNDNNAAINPGVTEVCNGIDDNCNGQVDEGTFLSPVIIAGGPTSFCGVGSVDLTAAMGNNAIQLDGLNQYIITPSLTAQLPTGSVTLELWFKANANGVIVSELGQPTINTGWHDSQIELLPDGHVKVRVWDLNSVDLGTVALGTWNHAVLRYNAATNTLDGALNGSPSADTASGTRLTPSANYWAFGAADGTNLGSGKYFNGQIDEIRIWNTAISNAQIAQNYNKSINPNAAGLVAYYKADETTGNTANDATANAAHATLVNTPTWVIPSGNALNAPAYLWSTTATTPVITASGSGGYYVQTTVSPNCQATSPTVNVAITAAPGDPSVFGNNQWNVYAFNSGNGTISGTDWSTNYAGYYTTSVLNFSTFNDWNSSTSPSTAANYQGCSVGYDNHSYTAKRQGFPCGYYSLDVPGHDEAAQLWINDTKVWEHDGCCDSHNGVWSGWLGANDKVEFRVTEGSGGSGGVLILNPSTTVSNGDPAVFGNNQWNVYAYNSGNGTIAGTDWNTNYAGYYTTAPLNFNTESDWAYLASPSAAANYQGCAVSVDQMSYTAKRQGFPCGYYTLDVQGHDDAAQLFVNGVKVWEHDGCCDSHTGIWSGWLRANDKVEFRISEGGGGSAGSLNFNLSNTITNGDPAVFGNNQWNVYAWNAGSGTLTTNNNWNTNYSGYYTNSSLDLNTVQDWNPQQSPSAATGYSGCTVANDNFSFSAKRQGFPCGKYRLTIQNHNDAMQLLVNDVVVFEHDACCDAHSGAWTGVLGANDKVEFRVTSGTGLSFGQLAFFPQPLGSTFTVNACNSYVWAAKGNKLYTASNNTDTALVKTANGCDSIVTLNLTIFKTTNSSVTVAACNSYVWNGRTYTSSTIDTFSYQDNNGCLIVDTLKLTVTKAKRYYVKTTASGANNGSSWTDAFTDLQTAINASVGCSDTIWVAGGRYIPLTDSLGVSNPTDNRTRTIKLKPGLVLIGGFEGSEDSLSQRNVLARQHISTIDGQNLFVPGNTGNYDGPCYHVLTATGSGNIVLDGFDVINAKAVSITPIDQNGGGIYASGVTMSINNCRFINNTAVNGCAVYSSNASISVSNCIMSGNLAAGYGGGVYSTGQKASLYMINTLVSGNFAYAGGAVYNEGIGATTFINCTFASNKTVGGGSFLVNNNNNPNIQNSIIWGNVCEADINRLIDNTNSSPNFFFCSIQPNYPGFNYAANYCDDLDPLFVNPKVAGVDSTGNYQVQECSPAIDRALQSLNTTSFDLAGNARSFNAYFTSRTVGNLGVVSDLDRGAYDYQAPIAFWYQDNDQDGFGNPSTGYQSCNQPFTGWVKDNTDCNDNDAQQRPGQVWYKDADNDGYAETGAATITQCLRPTGYKSAAELTQTTGDCNDSNANVNPGKAEICDNGIDDNCDGIIDFGTGTIPVITATGSTSFCKGDSVLLTSNYTNGNLWNTGETTQSIWAKRNISYSTTIQANGCGKASNSITVTYLSNYGDNNNYQQDVCINTPQTVNVNAVAGNTYSWSPSTGLSATNIANPTATIGANVQYILTETTPQGCVTKDTIYLAVVSPLPTPTIAASFNSCSTLVRLKTGSSMNDVKTVKWNFNGNVVKTIDRANDTVINALNLYNGDTINYASLYVKVKPNGEILIAQSNEHTIRNWQPFAANGTIVAGGNGSGNALNQLNVPRGMFLDKDGDLYVADISNNRVLKFSPGSSTGVIVAGGNGSGTGLNQIASGSNIWVDENKNVFVAERNNHRVTKWAPGATQGVVVAGGNGAGNNANQLGGPTSVLLDKQGRLYISETNVANRRISIWNQGATSGTTFVKNNGGSVSNSPINSPRKILFDGEDNLYVLDDYGAYSTRIQRFSYGDTIPTTVFNFNQPNTTLPEVIIDFDVSPDGVIYITKSRSKVVERGVFDSDNQFATSNTGSYTVSVINSGGCVNTSAPYVFEGPIYTKDTIVACGSVIWRGKTYTSPGTYYDTLTTVAGCDSIAQLNLIINKSLSSETTVAVCNKFTWNGTTYKVSGDYTWKGTSVSGCDSTATLHLTILSVTSTYTKKDVSCIGLNDGSITINPTYGVSPFTYRIGTTGAYGNANTFNDLKPGKYRVSILDANGCAGISDQVTIVQSSAIGLNLAKTNVTCFLKADGTITANGTGGVQPYQYRFGTAGTFSTNNRWTGLAPGVYSVLVKDANGCTASGSVTVTQPTTPVSATFTKTDESCPNAKNGSIILNATGGTAPYRYRLGTIGSFGSGNTFNNLKAGTYRVFVNDNSNCTGYSIGVVVGQTSPTCTVSTRSMVVKPEVPILQQGLTILLSPNPSNSYFTLRVKSTAESNVQIKVIDINGRSLFTAKGLPEQAFQFGESFAPGVYMIEVQQGENRALLKAVKLR